MNCHGDYLAYIGECRPCDMSKEVCYLDVNQILVQVNECEARKRKIPYYENCFTARANL